MIDPDELASFLAGHELEIDYGYEEEACSCGRWASDEPMEDNIGYHGHLVGEAVKAAEEER